MLKTLKSSEKSKVKQFIALTNASEKVAINCLSSNEWRLDLACDSYYTNPETFAVVPSVDTRRRVEQWFQRYCDLRVDAEKTSLDGVLRLLDDLHLDPNDRRVLILAWKCKAKQQCVFTRQEFIKGVCDELGVESVDALRRRCNEVELEVTRDVRQLRLLYTWTWNYANSDDNDMKKTLDCETACQYWKLLLNGLGAHIDTNTANTAANADTNAFAHNDYQWDDMIDMWTQFITDRWKRAITRDAWNLWFEFLLWTRENNLENYSLNDAWPSIVDEFVLWVRELKTNAQ